MESCGRNDAGQLADGTLLDSDFPVRINLPRSTRLRAVGAGPSSKSVFFVAGDEDVYAAGQNYRYQLGLDEVDPAEFPFRVELDGAPGLQRVAGVSASGSHTAAVSCDRFTGAPTTTPTGYPTRFPTQMPTTTPTEFPTWLPTTQPTLFPTVVPTIAPTGIPTITPTSRPTMFPTISPTMYPTEPPTGLPTMLPTITKPETPYPTLPPTLVSTVLRLVL